MDDFVESYSINFSPDVWRAPLTLSKIVIRFAHWLIWTANNWDLAKPSFGIRRGVK